MGSEPDAKETAAARPTFETYGEWLRERFNIDLELERNRYEREKLGMASAAEASPLWQEYQRTRLAMGDAYYAATSYRLFVGDLSEQIVTKPWVSFLHKSFRHNILNNDNWPDEPTRGWLTPECWFQRVHDIARTTIVVKYLDGVTRITDALAELAESNGVSEFSCEFEARDTGYYAAHIRTGFEFGLMSTRWREATVSGQYEIQVTTQLQEVIRKLTHHEYEQRRVRESEPSVKWQWDYTSDSFTPNYLGHILHYMEGMIMEVRDRGKARDV